MIEFRLFVTARDMIAFVLCTASRSAPPSRDLDVCSSFLMRYGYSSAFTR